MRAFAEIVETVEPEAKRQVIFDEATTGLALIVSPKGKKSFSIIARDPTGKQVWKRLGDANDMAVADARALAKQAVAQVRNGKEINPILPTAAPARAITRACAGCDYWQQLDALRGECRAMAPVVSDNGPWPKTSPEDWCSMFVAEAVF